MKYERPSQLCAQCAHWARVWRTEERNSLSRFWLNWRRGMKEPGMIANDFLPNSHIVAMPTIWESTHHSSRRSSGTNRLYVRLLNCNYVFISASSRFWLLKVCWRWPRSIWQHPEKMRAHCAWINCCFFVLMTLLNVAGKQSQTIW